MKLQTMVLALSAALAATAQTTARAPFIRASGEGVVSVKPDQARVNVAVNTQAATAEESAARNAEITTNVIAEVRKVIGSGGDVKTLGYNISPFYRPNTSPPVIAGYSVTNSVQVTVNDVNLVGRVLDTAIRAGANSSGGVQFSLRDSQTARAQALRLATQQARANADAIAQGLGGRTGRILAAADATSTAVTSIRDASGPVAAAAVSTPIETGSVEVRATVTIEAEIVIL